MSAKVPRFLGATSSAMADWATLQTDIVGIIIKKLAIPDYIRFRAVCTSWNRVCRDVSYRPRVDPWLMLPPNPRDGAHFLCLPERKNQIIRLPSTVSFFGSIWAPVGGSHGWIIYFSKTHGTMQLVNPISGKQIQLPTLGRRAFSKAMLLEMNERNFIVAVIYGDQTGYKVTRKGYNSWSSVQSEQKLEDIIKHRGQLYTCDMYGTVQVWAEPPRAWPDEDATHHWKFRCLVETPSGDLLRVKRVSRNKFAVWILDKGSSSWVEIDNIGDLALFVSNYNSLCFLAKDHCPSLKANCVYFIDTYNNLCAFNLENGTKELVETLAIGGARGVYGRPPQDQLLWFIPSLK